MRARGLILQASYRITAGVAVVHLYGRLESGETFLIRDHQQRPHFYIAARDAAKARTVIANEPIPTDRHTFGGEDVSGDYIANVDPIQTGVHVARHLAIQEIQNDLTGRGGFHISRSDRRARVDDDDRQAFGCELCCGVAEASVRSAADEHISSVAGQQPGRHESYR